MHTNPKKIATLWLFRCLLIIDLLLFITHLADAQGTPKVLSVTPENARLGHDITVIVQDLKTLNDRATCSDGRANCTKKNIVLYLDEMPIKGLIPEPPTDPANGTLRFHLKRTSDAKDVWDRILGNPGWKPRSTRVSVGIEDEFALPSDVNRSAKTKFELDVLPKEWTLFSLFLLVAILVIFLVLAWRTNLLRDSGPEPAGAAKRRFSLARCQMAWWFFLVLASYLFIGLITRDYTIPITGTVLGLLGISSATAVSSAVVDSNKSNSPKNQAERLNAQRTIEDSKTKTDNEIKDTKTELDVTFSEINGLSRKLVSPTFSSLPPDDQAQLKMWKGTLQEQQAKLKGIQAELQAEKQTLEYQAQKLNNVSQGWLLDILSDVNGASFHRFQIAAWTVVLGIIFVVSVYRSLSMPVFDGSLLALLGISAGTYIGYKIPEPTIPEPPKKP